MGGTSRFGGGRILVTPRESLVAGGAAEALEQQLQQLLRAGHRTVVIDLSAVTMIDSAGIRSLVRGHTTAQRLGCTIRLAAVPPEVARVLDAARLGGVFELHGSVEAARIAAWPWRTMATIVAGALLCALLVWVGFRWPVALAGLAGGDAALFGADAGAPAPGPAWQPLVELAKLAAAAGIGLLVTAVHRPASRDRLAARSMAHAQMLLCVAAALMMIVIGNSLARAFGVVGAASIIRFRTAVDDPKDVTIIFILMGLGMAAGLGMLAVAGLGTAFLCATLLLMDVVAGDQARLAFAEIVSEGRHFPFKSVEEVFARHQIVFEPREIAQENQTTVKYHAWLDAGMSLEDLSTQIRNIPGVAEVGWEHPKRQ
jgi:anti-anti-sigma factor